MLSRGLLLLSLGALLAACPKKPADDTTTGPPPPAALTREDRLQIARLEAQREGGVTRLIELTRDRHAPRRLLALRALGRIASPDAITALRGALSGADAEAAAAALGIAGATGALDPEEAG